MGQNLESHFLHLAHLIRSINDPEHPLTLEELNVVEQVRIQVSDPESTVAVAFTPTIPHCSMATLIGLSIKVKLLRSLPQRFKVSWSRAPTSQGETNYWGGRGEHWGGDRKDPNSQS